MYKIFFRLVRFLNPYQKTVYYDPKTRNFLQLKFAQDNGVLCGGFSGYYEDSMTNIQRQIISYNYIWGCQEVGSVDKFEEAELCPMTKSYKVKGGN